MIELQETRDFHSTTDRQLLCVSCIRSLHHSRIIISNVGVRTSWNTKIKRLSWKRGVFEL